MPSSPCSKPPAPPNNPTQSTLSLQNAPRDNLAGRFYNQFMQILRNYYARWFSCAFLVGVIVPPIFFFGWTLFQHFSTAGQLQAQGLPVVLVTNLFVDITNSSGNVIASGNVAFLIAVAVCGLCAGIFGLGLAALNRLIRK